MINKTTGIKDTDFYDRSTLRNMLFCHTLSFGKNIIFWIPKSRNSEAKQCNSHIHVRWNVYPHFGINYVLL